MSSYPNRIGGDKTILRPFYIHNGISYTLYWIRARVLFQRETCQEAWYSRIIQYRGHFFSKIITKTLHSSPVRARYGVSPLWIINPIYILHFLLSRYMLYHVISERVMKMSNWPVAQITQCTSPISQNAPFCNRNVHMCAHFCYEMCILRYLSNALGDLWDDGFIVCWGHFWVVDPNVDHQQTSAIHSQTLERVL